MMEYIGKRPMAGSEEECNITSSSLKIKRDRGDVAAERSATDLCTASSWS